jgi:hypothetical protein
MVLMLTCIGRCRRAFLVPASARSQEVGKSGSGSTVLRHLNWSFQNLLFHLSNPISRA